MIEINKREMKYFQQQGYGFPEPLHRSHGKHCKYYLTENPKLLGMLWDLRKIKSKEN